MNERLQAPRGDAAANEPVIVSTSEGRAVIQPVVNESGLEIQPLYTADDVEASGGLGMLGKPGEYPFTRGIHPLMYRKQPWTMRQYTGFGNAADTNGSQPLVANGLQFDRHGNLFIADTARGAIWKVRFRSDGSVASRMGCDSTFPANTLCLENVFYAHPFFEGVDGIVLDVRGNIWGSANERNAIVYMSNLGYSMDVFRKKYGEITFSTALSTLRTAAEGFMRGRGHPGPIGLHVPMGLSAVVAGDARAATALGRDQAEHLSATAETLYEGTDRALGYIRFRDPRSGREEQLPLLTFTAAIDPDTHV